MDLMHTGRFDGLVLVSPDSDFARLASRLQKQGLQVHGIGKTNTPEAFRKACKRFIFEENLLGDGEALRETEETVRPESTGSKPEGKVPIAQTKQGVSSEEAPSAARDKTETVVTGPRQPATKAVPLVIAAMQAHDDWVPLSVIRSHVHAANPEFDPRTYGCAKLVDLLEKTGQFEVKRNRVPVRARRKRLQLSLFGGRSRSRRGSRSWSSARRTPTRVSDVSARGRQREDEKNYNCRKRARDRTVTRTMGQDPRRMAPRPQAESGSTSKGGARRADTENERSDRCSDLG